MEEDKNRGTSEEVKFCKTCGERLKENARFCTKCGAGTEEELVRKLCPSCGAELSEGQVFCTKCGNKIGEAPDNNSINYMSPKKSGSKNKALVAAAVVVVLIVGFFGIQGVQKKQLHEKLQSAEWWSYDDGTKLYLDFSDSYIDYDGYFGILGRRDIAILDYEVISGSKIKVEGIEIEVEFGDGTVTFSPSFINGDSISMWLD